MKVTRQALQELVAFDDGGSVAGRLAKALPKPTLPSALGVNVSASDAAQAVALNVISLLRSEAALEATSEALRVCVHSVLRRHPHPVQATEQWLRRVVPMAVRISSEEAAKLAVDALQCFVAAPTPRVFSASYDVKNGAVIGVVDPERPQVWRKQLARFTPYRLADRKLLAASISRTHTLAAAALASTPCSHSQAVDESRRLSRGRSCRDDTTPSYAASRSSQVPDPPHATLRP